MGTCRYTSTFYGQNSGIEYRFELHDLDYSGASTEVDLDAGGAVIEWTQDDNIFAPIRSSQCTAVMKITDSTMERQEYKVTNKRYKLS